MTNRGDVLIRLQEQEFITMQLPYLNGDGAPRVIDINMGDAYMLYKAGVVRILWNQEGSHKFAVCVPCIPAEQNVTLPRVRGVSRAEWCFTTTGTTPYSGFSNTKEAIHNEMERLNGSPVPHWRWHDLRHVISTRLNAMKISSVVVEAILNHASGGNSSVAGLYNHYEYYDEKREALAEWATFIQSVVDSSTPPT